MSVENMGDGVGYLGDAAASLRMSAEQLKGAGHLLHAPVAALALAADNLLDTLHAEGWDDSTPISGWIPGEVVE